MSKSHPQCWRDGQRHHECHEPSGRTCLDCDQPAGTPWTSHWCPEHDVIRLDRIVRNLTAIRAANAAWTARTPRREWS